ncbi:hypothetical protein BS47DRAFT_1117809 [Hydnum rufescens UP504]|uniref:Uncharacterized protein n=1 Tax=Hydnum rufescens UP504 TaxID=1448309 RepID=A0A9P6DUW4_9AGAM|nr:hypothetical protein BS47DRAFT_1117809 [Hydnum rufescens UP504]
MSSCLSTLMSQYWSQGAASPYLQGEDPSNPCDIKPGSLPFAVDVIPPIRERLDRDSTDHLLPGAYLILKDGTKFSPGLAARSLGSKGLNLFPRVLEINTAPPSIPASAFCNITGASLSDENKSVVQIIQNRDAETRWVIVSDYCTKIILICLGLPF